MSKIKITADAVLDIISGIIDDEDINVTITDTSATSSWQGKTIKEILNVEYFTFKHRPVSTEELIAEKIKNKETVNQLAGLNRAFCGVSLEGIERVFAKDVDTIVATANMEYWVQTSKVQLLETMIENCNISLCGLRIPVAFGNETRKAIIIFSPVIVSEIQPGTVCGEMAVCNITVNLLLYPDVVSYCDYTLKFDFEGTDGPKSEVIPVESFSYVNTMTQKSVPYVQNVGNVGNINLSSAKSFVLVCDGYNNAFVNHLSDKALSTGKDGENNQVYTMTITRADKSYTHYVVVKDHKVTVASDTGNETHTISLVTQGI